MPSKDGISSAEIASRLLEIRKVLEESGKVWIEKNAKRSERVKNASKS